MFGQQCLTNLPSCYPSTNAKISWAIALLKLVGRPELATPASWSLWWLPEWANSSAIYQPRGWTSSSYSTSSPSSSTGGLVVVVQAYGCIQGLEELVLQRFTPLEGWKPHVMQQLETWENTSPTKDKHRHTESHSKHSHQEMHICAPKLVSQICGSCRLAPLSHVWSESFRFSVNTYFGNWPKVLLAKEIQNQMIWQCGNLWKTETPL